MGYAAGWLLQRRLHHPFITGLYEMKITQETADAIRRLSREAALSGQPEEVRPAAAQTGGVPVYCDMGGILLVTAEGIVLTYDDSGAVRVEPEEGWRTVALVHAARKFPELEPLRPIKPEGALPCAACSGTGPVFDKIDCGACFAAGWQPLNRPIR